MMKYFTALPDTDGDGLHDAEEDYGWTVKRDINGDGDTDDTWVYVYGSWGQGYASETLYPKGEGGDVFSYWKSENPYFDATDSDLDGLNDREEKEHYTDPMWYDTDFDWLEDVQDTMNPLTNLSISFNIKEILQLDPVDDGSGSDADKDNTPADFYLKIKMDADGDITWKNTAIPIEKDNGHITTPQKLIFPVDDNIEEVTFTVYLYDDDSGTGELCDISPSANYYATLHYSLKNGTWWGDDSIGDSDNYGRINGTYDGSDSTDENDCELCFDIKQNEVDGDSLMYWEELNVYGTSPIVRNDKAVLIVGGEKYEKNYAAFWDDLVFMYDILRNKDYAIIVVYADGNPPNSENCIGYGWAKDIETHSDIIDYAATKKNLKKVFSLQGYKVGPLDQLFVWFNDHGTNLNENNTYEDSDDQYKYSYLSLWDYNPDDSFYPRIRDDVFASEYIGLVKNYNKMIILIEACHSGGFIDDLSGPRRIIITSCTKKETSAPADGLLPDRASINATSVADYLDSNETGYGEFTYHFQSALNWATPSGTPVNADTNSDGKISILEAFNYAFLHDSLDGQFIIPNLPGGRGYYNDKETPQYDDNGDGESHQYRDANGMPQNLLPCQGDGTLGGETYL